MLHIHNGDSSANALKESGLGGEHLPFREALMSGPAPKDLPQEEWLKARAQFLAADYELDEKECLGQLVKEAAALESFRDHEETVLWFEHDLFCQVNLIYLLDWFQKRERGKTRLSLICIGEFPGVEDFRGLGQLTPAQLLALFGTRREVADDQLRLASKAWRAYCSPDPTAIEGLTGEDMSALLFLRGAFLRHLARLPSVRNGLGHVENRALQLIADGHTSFKSLFPRFGNTDSAYGVGDAQFWNDVKRMAQCEEPLIEIRGLDDLNRAFKGNRYHDASFELTEKGGDVIAGKDDYVEMNGIDRWLGGAHLTENNLWRWDEQRQKLTQ
jgi:hypothetical protein